MTRNPAPGSTPDLATPRAPVPFPEPWQFDESRPDNHHVVFYGDPASLTEDVIDPLLWPIVQTINASGWVWTAEACQGHPEDDSDFGPWAGNLRPMIRLVCRLGDRGRMLAALADAIEAPAGGSMPVEPWFSRRPWTKPRYFEALVYLGSKSSSVGERNRAIEAWTRFAAALDPTPSEGASE